MASIFGWLKRWWNAPKKETKAAKTKGCQEPSPTNSSKTSLGSDYSAATPGPRGLQVPGEEFPGFACEDKEDADKTPMLNQRFIVSNGTTVGIANTQRRYHTSRPVQLHGTPFEVRVDKWLAESEAAAGGTKAASVTQANTPVQDQEH